MKRIYQKPVTELLDVSAPYLFSGSGLSSGLSDTPATGPGKARMDNGIWDDDEELDYDDDGW
jgi:hypothetical protein